MQTLSLRNLFNTEKLLGELRVCLLYDWERQKFVSKTTLIIYIPRQYVNRAQCLRFHRALESSRSGFGILALPVVNQLALDQSKESHWASASSMVKKAISYLSTDCSVD